MFLILINFHSFCAFCIVNGEVQYSNDHRANDQPENGFDSIVSFCFVSILAVGACSFIIIIKM